MKIRSFHIIVKGMVQGVGFRYWTSSLAVRLNIKGWVRNRIDYSVEIIAEAEIDVLEKFINTLRYEHPYARVESIVHNEISLKGYSNFVIER